MLSAIRDSQKFGVIIRLRMCEKSKGNLYK